MRPRFESWRAHRFDDGCDRNSFEIIGCWNRDVSDALDGGGSVGGLYESSQEVRGDFAPLFYSVSHRCRGHRLAGSSIWSIVRQMGSRCGVKVWPHGCRHTAVTAGLDATGGDVRSVRQFSRHANVETLLLYDDARQNLGGKVADMVAARIG